MAKKGKKRGRSRRVRSGGELETGVSESRDVGWRLHSSAMLFVVSVLIFGYQCVIPMFTQGTLKRVAEVRVKSGPREWHRGETVVGGWEEEAGEEEGVDVGRVRRDGNGEVRNASVVLGDIADGPVELPRIGGGNGSNAGMMEGMWWSGSLAKGVMSALPVHWVMEQVYGRSAEEGGGERGESIFEARRKGKWMGCEREEWVVCKGVYRAIKVTNAIRVIDLACGRNVGWLPFVVRKLREEFRMVRLVCVVGKGNGGGLRDKYEGVDLEVDEVEDVMEANFRNGTDMVIGYRSLEAGSMVEAMRFLRRLKEEGTVGVLVMESYPERKNGGGGEEGKKLRLNMMGAPFWFPTPVYEYENLEEDWGGDHMRIVAVKVEEMFERDRTPKMKDLIDPRKRQVVE